MEACNSNGNHCKHKNRKTPRIESATTTRKIAEFYRFIYSRLWFSMSLFVLLVPGIFFSFSLCVAVVHIKIMVCAYYNNLHKFPFYRISFCYTKTQHIYSFILCRCASVLLFVFVLGLIILVCVCLCGQMDATTIIICHFADVRCETYLIRAYAIFISTFSAKDIDGIEKDAVRNQNEHQTFVCQ